MTARVLYSLDTVLTNRAIILPGETRKGDEGGEEEVERIERNESKPF
jgi:hypothetical protein